MDRSRSTRGPRYNPHQLQHQLQQAYYEIDRLNNVIDKNSGKIKFFKSEVARVQGDLVAQNGIIASQEKEISTLKGSQPKLSEQVDVQTPASVDGLSEELKPAGPQDHQAATVRHLEQMELEVIRRENRRLKTIVKRFQKNSLDEKNHSSSKVEHCNAENRHLPDRLDAQEKTKAESESADTSLAGETKQVDSRQQDPQDNQVSSSGHLHELEHTRREKGLLEGEVAHLKQSLEDEKKNLIEAMGNFKSDITHLQGVLFAQRNTIRALTEEISALKANPRSAGPRDHPAPTSGHMRPKHEPRQDNWENERKDLWDKITYCKSEVARVQGDLVTQNGIITSQEKEISALKGSQQQLSEQVDVQTPESIDGPREEPKPTGPQDQQAATVRHLEQMELEVIRRENRRLKTIVKRFQKKAEKESANTSLVGETEQVDSCQEDPTPADLQDNQVTTSGHLHELKHARHEKGLLEGEVAHLKKSLEDEKKNFLETMGNFKSDITHFQGVLFAQKNTISALTEENSALKANPSPAGPQDHPAPTSGHMRPKHEPRQDNWENERKDLLGKIKFFKSEVARVQGDLQQSYYENDCLNDVIDKNSGKIKFFKSEVARVQGDLVAQNGIIASQEKEISTLKGSQPKLSEQVDVQSHSPASVDGPSEKPKPAGPQDHQATTIRHLEQMELEVIRRENRRLKTIVKRFQKNALDEKNYSSSEVEHYKAENRNLLDCLDAQEKTKAENESADASLVGETEQVDSRQQDPQDNQVSSSGHLHELEHAHHEKGLLEGEVAHLKKSLEDEKKNFLEAMGNFKSDITHFQSVLFAQKNTISALTEENSALKANPSPAGPQDHQAPTSGHMQPKHEPRQDNWENERKDLWDKITYFKSEVARVQGDLVAQNGIIASQEREISALKGSQQKLSEQVDVQTPESVEGSSEEPKPAGPQDHQAATIRHLEQMELEVIRRENRRLKTIVKRFQKKAEKESANTSLVGETKQVDSCQEDPTPADLQDNQVTTSGHLHELEHARHEKGLLEGEVAHLKKSLEDEKKNFLETMGNFKSDITHFQGVLFAQKNTISALTEENSALKANPSPAGPQDHPAPTSGHMRPKHEPRQDNWENERKDLWDKITYFKSEVARMQGDLVAQNGIIASQEKEISTLKSSQPKLSEQVDVQSHSPASVDGPSEEPKPAGPQDQQAATVRHLEQMELEVIRRENRRLKAIVKRFQKNSLDEKNHSSSEVEHYKAENRHLLDCLDAQEKTKAESKSADASPAGETKQVDSRQQDPQDNQVSSSGHLHEMEHARREKGLLEGEVAHLKKSLEDEKKNFLEAMANFKSDITHFQGVLFAQKNTISTLTEENSALKANPSPTSPQDHQTPTSGHMQPKHEPHQDNWENERKNLSDKITYFKSEVARVQVDLVTQNGIIASQEKEISILKGSQPKLSEQVDVQTPESVEGPSEEPKPAGPQDHQAATIHHLEQMELEVIRRENRRLKTIVKRFQKKAEKESANTSLAGETKQVDSRQEDPTPADLQDNQVTTSGHLHELEHARREKGLLEGEVAHLKKSLEDEKKNFLETMDNFKSDITHFQSVLFAQKNTISALTEENSALKANPSPAGPQDHPAPTSGYMRPKHEPRQDNWENERKDLWDKITYFKSEVVRVQRDLFAQKNTISALTEENSALHMRPKHEPCQDNWPPTLESEISALKTKQQEYKEQVEKLRSQSLQDSLQNIELNLDKNRVVQLQKDLQIRFDLLEQKLLDRTRENLKLWQEIDRRAQSEAKIDADINLLQEKYKELLEKEYERLQNMELQQKREGPTPETETDMKSSVESEYICPQDNITETEEDMKTSSENEDICPQDNITETETDMKSSVENEDICPQDNITETETDMKLSAGNEDICPKDKITETETDMKTSSENEDVCPQDNITETEEDMKTSSENEDVCPQDNISVTEQVTEDHHEEFCSEKDKTKKKSGSFFKWLTRSQSSEDEAEKRMKKETKQEEKELKKQKQLEEDDQKMLEKKAKKEKKKRENGEKKQQKQEEEERKRLEKRAKQEMKNREEDEKKSFWRRKK